MLIGGGLFESYLLRECLRLRLLRCAFNESIGEFDIFFNSAKIISKLATRTYNIEIYILASEIERI